MSRRLPFLLIGLSVILALGTGLLAYNWLEPKREQPAETIPTEQVAVASRALTWATTLTDEMVRLVPFPSESLPEGYFSSSEDLRGRIVLRDVQRHEIILESKLAALSAGVGKMVAIMDPKKRAMAVKVDAVVGVAGFVRPGDRVDVLVTMARSRRQAEIITKTVLENMLVLATGTEMERKAGDQSAKLVKVITLEVSPEDAEKLAQAAARGKIRLALRSPLDQEIVLTKGATSRSVLDSHREKPRYRRQAPKPTVEVIKGTSVSKEQF